MGEGTKFVNGRLPCLQPDSHPTRKRFREIDAMRGIAVLLMVMSHALHWLSPLSAHDIVPLFGKLSPGDIATGLFLVTAGLSLRLSLDNNIGRTSSTSPLLRHYLTRFGHLFLIGVALSLSWGVLQAQAVTLASIVFAQLSMTKRTRQEKTALWTLLIGAVCVLHMYLYWGIEAHRWGSRIFFSQFPPTGLFLLSATGFHGAPLLRQESFWTRASWFGAVTLLAVAALAVHGYPPTRPGLGPLFLVTTLGAASLLLSFLHSLHNVRPQLLYPLILTGRDALYLFIFHYLAIGFPLHAFRLHGHLETSAAVAGSLLLTLFIAAIAWRRQGERPDGYQWSAQVATSCWQWCRALFMSPPPATTPAAISTSMAHPAQRRIQSKSPKLREQTPLSPSSAPLQRQLPYVG